MRSVFVLALILILPISARAATFQWQSATAGGGCCTATLEIADDAAKGGSITSEINIPGPAQALPDNPIVRFQIMAYGDSLTFDRASARGFYTFNVSVVGDTLSGDIHVNDISTDTSLSGTQGGWTVQNHHSDHPGACFRANNKCAGDAGHWVRIQPTAAVAENTPP